MRVVSKPDPEWKLETSCDRCEVRLEVELGDFSRTIFDQRDGDAAIFKCPECGKENWVDLKLIPQRLHHRLCT